MHTNKKHADILWARAECRLWRSEAPRPSSLPRPRLQYLKGCATFCTSRSRVELKAKYARAMGRKYFPSSFSAARRAMPRVHERVDPLRNARTYTTQRSGRQTTKLMWACRLTQRPRYLVPLLEPHHPAGRDRRARRANDAQHRRVPKDYCSPGYAWRT